MKRKGDDPKKAKVSWSAPEDDALLKAVLDDQNAREPDADEEEDWDEIAKSVPEKTPVQCLKRYLALNRKQASAVTAPQASSPVPAEKLGDEDEDENDEDEEEDEEEEEESESQPTKKQKLIKKETESSGKWTPDEIELLRKLVEQYKDCKYRETMCFCFAS
jgi:hypothetical protein